MKNILVIVIIILFASASCREGKIDNNSIQVVPCNYMILLDLSDRLITTGQSERDIEIIKTVYAEFNHTVRKNLVINSKDKFQVIIAPQKGVPYSAEEFENSLFLDMGSISAGMKVNTLGAFENNLPGILQNLYSKAFIGKKACDYQGTGIWQFFNENLEYLAGTNYNNILVVLTDGYFDLEDYSKQLAEGNRFPTTSFLSTIRNKPDWKILMEKNDMGLLPVKKDFPGMKVFVAEVNPKYDFQYEADMLVYVWQKWCKEMHIHQTDVFVKTSLPQTVSLLSSKLKAM